MGSWTESFSTGGLVLDPGEIYLALIEATQENGWVNIQYRSDTYAGGGLSQRYDYDMFDSMHTLPATTRASPQTSLNCSRPRSRQRHPSRSP
jgi:hypothetical protein